MSGPGTSGSETNQAYRQPDEVLASPVRHINGGTRLGTLLRNPGTWAYAYSGLPSKAKTGLTSKLSSVLLLTNLCSSYRAGGVTDTLDISREIFPDTS